MKPYCARRVCKLSAKINAKSFFSAVCLTALCFLILSGCEKKSGSAVETDFTKADSLTETYLALQDTMLQVWNTMIHDDNRKIKAMDHLLHELRVSNPEKREQLRDLEGRLHDLSSMRYDQSSISDSERVSAYDFASNSLVTEIISLAESQKEFAYNTTLQKLVDSIRGADQRVINYRVQYDMVTSRFNRFLERNRSMLKEIAEDSTLKEKPLFRMAAE